MRNLLYASILVFFVAGTGICQTVPGLQSPGSSQWRYVISSSDGDTHFYSILKGARGDVKEMWDKAVSKDDNLIVVTLKEYNCESGADRLIHITTYRGDEISSNSSYDDTQWRYSKPNTIGAALLQAACGERKREWTYVGDSKKGVAYFLKLNSVSRSGTFLRVWSKSVESEETQSMTLWEFDCQNLKLRSLQSTNYERDNNFTTGSRTWSYVVPESIGEMLLTAACKANRHSRSRNSR